MGVLDVENRIVLGRLHHLHEVEIERCVGAARQHHEPHHVAPDLLHHLGEGDEVSGTFRHLHRLAAAEQPHHLDEPDVEIDPPIGQRLHRRLDALDGAGVVGAPDVDQVIGLLRFLPVIGGIGAEIGPAAVRLLDRPILVVAELGRAE